MAILGRFTKQPSEVLDYDVDYSDWLEGEDVVDSISVVVDPGITLEGHFLQGPVAKVVLSGGVSGNKYKVTVRASTENQLVKEADFLVVVKEF